MPHTSYYPAPIRTLLVQSFGDLYAIAEFRPDEIVYRVQESDETVLLTNDASAADAELTRLAAARGWNDCNATGCVLLANDALARS